MKVSLTPRNWTIGCEIAEYDLCGQDRVAYSASQFPKLAQRLETVGGFLEDKRQEESDHG